MDNEKFNRLCKPGKLNEAWGRKKSLAASKKNKKWTTMNQIHGSHYVKKVGEDLKESYLKEAQQFLDKGKTQDYAEIAAFNTLLPVSRRLRTLIYSV